MTKTETTVATKTEADRIEALYHIRDFAGETHTKRGRARLVAMARRELGFPFTIRGTSEAGVPYGWQIATPTDARVFVESASSRIDWMV